MATNNLITREENLIEVEGGQYGRLARMDFEIHEENNLIFFKSKMNTKNYAWIDLHYICQSIERACVSPNTYVEEDHIVIVAKKENIDFSKIRKSSPVLTGGGFSWGS